MNESFNSFFSGERRSSSRSCGNFKMEFDPSTSASSIATQGTPQNADTILRQLVPGIRKCVASRNDTVFISGLHNIRKIFSMFGPVDTHILEEIVRDFNSSIFYE